MDENHFVSLLLTRWVNHIEFPAGAVKRLRLSADQYSTISTRGVQLLRYKG